MEVASAVPVEVSATITTRAAARSRRRYQLTEQGTRAHLDWIRQPVVPETVAADLGLHLLRFVMMANALSADAVLEFLVSLRAALAGFVASLELSAKEVEATGNTYAALAVEHRLAVHRASLAWAVGAIERLVEEARQR